MKNKFIREKIVPILQIIIATAVIVISTLGLVGVSEKATEITTPLLGVLLMIQAYSNWKNHKGVAIFCLCAGAFVLIVSIVILVIM